MKTITIAEHAGTCFGVDNAIKIAFEAAKRCENNNIHIKGQLVHNPIVVEKIKKEGVKEIDDVEDLKEGDQLIIRAHGELKSVYDYCNENNIELVDCTCPFVKKAQNLAKELEKEGYQVIIIGESDHPEVRGIIAQTDNAFAIALPEEIDEEKIRKFKKIGILSQTTQKIKNLKAISDKILGLAQEVKIHNTICNATSQRQTSATKLAKEVDIMIVIGGMNSSNTMKLYELCKEITKTYWIATEDSLKKEWFENNEKIGITAGASTPSESIDKVKEKIEKFIE